MDGLEAITPVNVRACGFNINGAYFAADRATSSATGSSPRDRAQRRQLAFCLCSTWPLYAL